jgi:2-keto-4-pentenoate hydratase
MAHAVEVVQCPHADWKVTLDECNALNALHARLVVGAPMPLDARTAAALPELAVVLMKNGQEVDRGKGANVLDSPLLALSKTRDLKAGEIVSTGTLTDAHAIAPGERWSTRFSGLPVQGLEISFE